MVWEPDAVPPIQRVAPDALLLVPLLVTSWLCARFCEV